MTDHGDDPPPGEEPDAGEPIRELADLSEPASAGFLERLRNKIERRDTASSLLGLAWNVPLLLVLEFLDMIFRFVAGQSDRKGDAK